MTESKTCAGCGREFSRPPGVRRAKWEARAFCSRACGARAPRKYRYDTPDEKACAHCGVTFRRPKTYNGGEWERRKYCSRECMGRAATERAWEGAELHECAICKVEYRCAPSETVWRRTCLRADCQSEYKRKVASLKVSATAKANYASGARTPNEGISRRERMLWPLLAPDGWLWRLRWTEADGPYELDFALLDLKLNVEIDGPEHGWTRRRPCR